MLSMHPRGALRHTRFQLAALPIAAVLGPAATAHAWQALPAVDTVPANQPGFTLTNEAPVTSPTLSLGLVGSSGETPIPCDLVTLEDPIGDGSIEYVYALRPRAPLTAGTTVAFHHPYLDAPSTTTFAVTDALALPSGDAVIGRRLVVHLSGATPTDIESTLTATTSGGDLLAWGDRLDMRVSVGGVLVSLAPREVASHFVSWNAPVDCSGATPGDPHFVAIGSHDVHVRIGTYGLTPEIDTHQMLTIDCVPTYVDADDGHTLTPAEVAQRLGPQPDSGLPPGPDAAALARDGGVTTPTTATSGCSTTPTRGAPMSLCVLALGLALARRKRR